MPRQSPNQPVNIPLPRLAITTVDLLLSALADTVTALLLALIARDSMGMPPDIVREDALIVVGAIIVVLADMYPYERQQ
jgi:hypothetical protein